MMLQVGGLKDDTPEPREWILCRVMLSLIRSYIVVEHKAQIIGASIYTNTYPDSWAMLYLFIYCGLNFKAQQQ